MTGREPTRTRKPKRPAEPVQTSMTPELARGLLSRPLVFGDPEQLRAVAFLAELHQARGRVLGCKVCRGAGINGRGTACRFCSAHLSAELAAALGLPAAAVPAPKRQGLTRLTLFDGKETPHNGESK